jgi:hypothetical protein
MFRCLQIINSWFRLSAARSKLVVAHLLFGFAAGGLGQAQTTTAISYQLNPESQFIEGCFPPCLCPISIGKPVTGTFLLTPTGTDGSFNTYTVTEVNWVFSRDNVATVVTGSGTYKVASGSAPQQELSLDLLVGDDNVEHFDSGLVAASFSFPNINLSISVHGQVCFDKVFAVSASPGPGAQLGVALASANRITLSWLGNSSAFVLQENSWLTPTNWISLTNTPIVKGQESQVFLPRPAGNRFYRLIPGGN